MTIASRQRARGQTLVIFTMALAVLILGSGVVVDVGYAWSEQRNVQNAADSGAKSGALVLAQRAAQPSSATPLTMAEWDEKVRNAIAVSASINKSTFVRAEYTDYLGNLLGVDVGLGTIPANAAGVQVFSRKTPPTFLLRLPPVSMTQWTITQKATAVSGPTTACTVEDACVNLPITFPVTVYQCTNNGKTQPIDPPQQWVFGQELVLPICGGNPGSVGWIDWEPPYGGTSELTGDIYEPPPFEIPLPSWQYITQTGGISAAQVEDALNSYAGQIVQVPIFDSTCPETPTSQLTSGCTNPGGTGTIQWYHIIKFLSFRLASPQGAWLQGGTGNEVICGTNATQCLKGTFVAWVTEGTVAAPCTLTPDECSQLDYAVQLIK